ncbi:MAG: hypothetical protein JF598_05080 [Streptomyces sp.]|nr:hypothetical protein [Streptomyces sp.]
MRLISKIGVLGMCLFAAACGSGGGSKTAAPPAVASGTSGASTASTASTASGTAGPGGSNAGGNITAGGAAGVGGTRQIVTSEFTLEVTLVKVIDPDPIPGATPTIPHLPEGVTSPGPLRFVTAVYRITNKGPGTLRANPNYSQSPLTTNIDTATGAFPDEDYWTSTAGPKLDFGANPLAAGQTATGAVTATVPVADKVTEVKCYAGMDDAATAIWQTP